MMQKTPNISILVANYNNGSYIVEMLDSILSQQLPLDVAVLRDWVEVVIIDDCSKDNSLSIISEYAAKHRNDIDIHVFQNERNLGCGGTKRRCIELARGEYFIFIDPDDKITPDSLLKLYTKMQSSSFSIVYASHYLCDNNLNIKSKSNWVGPIATDESHFTSTSGHISAPALCSMRCYRKTEGINARYVVCEDQDLYCKMEEVAPIFYIDEAMYFYRAHDHNMSRNRQSDLLNSFWKLQFQLDTYHRRKVNNYPINLPLAQIKTCKQQYYTKSFRLHYCQKKYLKSIWALFLAIVYRFVNIF